jgi:hypothetical protein
MEIGLSQDVLIDVGLNAVGFLLGGTIIMLLAGFRKSHRAAVDLSAGSAAAVPPPMAPTPKETAVREEKTDF